MCKSVCEQLNTLNLKEQIEYANIWILNNKDNNTIVKFIDYLKQKINDVNIVL